MTSRILLIAAILIGAGTAQAQNDERILHYHSDITVHEDGGMTVRETIRVNVLGQQIRRGIYRDFPTTYRDSHGNKVVVGFDVEEVLRDGSPDQYRTESVRNGVRVYIGQRDYLLPHGEHTYTLVYRTTRQLGFFDEHDELYWNVTGNGWGFPIDLASAAVTLPEGISESDIGLEAYTGIQGARGADYTAEVEGPGRALFSTTRPLAPREGLSIVVTFPKGFVEEPTLSAEIGFLFKRRAGDVAAIGGFLVVLAYYFIVWLRVGVDPAKRSVPPRDAPPEHFSPEALRYIRRMGFDPKTFSVALINMAVKGYVRIEQEGEKGSEKYFVVRDQADEQVLTEEERVIAQSLFDGRESIEFDQSNHKIIGATQREFAKTLKDKYKGVYFHRNGGYLALGIVLSIVCMGVSALLTAEEAAPIAFAIATAALVIVNVTFAFLLKAPTREGRRLLDEIESFSMYLKGEGLTRFSTQASPETLRTRFEQYLPFAIALGMEEPWAEEFTRALDTTSQTPQTYSPLWYHGANWHTLGAHGFASSLSDGFATVVASSAAAPGSTSGSSGFSGGGFSGGGGGGGGGGGW